MFRKLFVSFSIIIFLTIAGITIFKINQSISPLSVSKITLSDSVTNSDLKDFQIIPPLVSDSDKIFFIVQNTAGETFISGLDPLMNELLVYSQINSAQTDIAGFAKDHSARFFTFPKVDSTSLCFLLNNDSTFALFSQPILSNERIVSVSLSKDVPEIATIVDTIPQCFRMYSLKSSENSLWQQRSVRRNPFFINISTPLAAYYRSTWHYLSTSEYYRREDLYVRTPPGTSNIMVFQNNLSYHLDDVRVQERTFGAKQLDMALTGMLTINADSSTQYSFNPTTLTIEEIQTPDNAREPLPLFHTVNGYPKRFMIFKTQSLDSLVLKIDNTIKHLCIETEKDSNKSIFKIPENDDADFACIDGDFSDVFLLPYQNGYIFLLNNGHFCLLDNNFDRKDNINFFSTIKNLCVKNFNNLFEYPSQLKSWAIPIAITGFPILTLLVLFFFFISRVFLTPRRPAYSSRQQKRTPFIAFWFPACILWIIAIGITFIQLIEEIKIL